MDTSGAQSKTGDIPVTSAEATATGRTNRAVVAVLSSRAHRLLSKRICVVHYRGRRSGRPYLTPTQYAPYEDGFVIVVGKPDTKTWWRNFDSEGGHAIEVLVRGAWNQLQGRVVTEDTDAELTTTLLDAYLAHFPIAARAMGSSREALNSTAVIVWCKP